MSSMWVDRFCDRTKWHAHANALRYDVPADPWRFIEVDPTTVERGNSVSFAWGLGLICRGEWDQPEHCGRIEELIIFRGLKQRFQRGWEWEETVYFGWIEEQYDLEVDYRGYETVESRLKAIDELYEDMRDHGYRSNRGVIYEDPVEIEHIHELDPLVLVGRSGEIIWSEGFHRLVIAALLEIEGIPVYVLRRHERWQRIRDEIATTPPDDRRPELREHMEHPDLSDVVE